MESRKKAKKLYTKLKTNHFHRTLCTHTLRHKSEKNGREKTDLWIGTSEGLNSFDGNSITTYYKNKYPEIQSDLIEKILIDPENRIWIRNNSHYITLLDENRKFHKILSDTICKYGKNHLFSEVGLC